MKLFELSSRKRLDDIEDAKQQQPDDGTCDTHRDQEQRDEHPADFIDHNRAWIDSSEVTLRSGGGPDTNAVNRVNGRAFQHDYGAESGDETIDNEPSE